MTDKLKHLSVFGSQFKITAMTAAVEKSAKTSSHAGLTEPLWTLTRRPESWDWEAVPPQEPLSESESASYANWLEALKKADAARILMLAPAGRFATDVRWLRRINPQLAVDAFVTEASQDEVEAAELPGVRVTKVGSGAANWSRLAGKLALASSVPTLFLAGRRKAEARKLALLWPLSPTLVVTSLNEAMHGLTAVQKDHAGGQGN